MIPIRCCLQADLGSIRHLTHIGTQCRSGLHTCVTSYYVYIKSDIIEDFAPVCGHQSCPRLFTGNEATGDYELVVMNQFDWLVTARYVRLNPQSWAGSITMRWELYYCP